MTQVIKEMCAVDNCDCIGMHKHAGTTRVARDDGDFQKQGEAFSSGVLNYPFGIPDDLQDIQIPLSNLATGVLLSDAEANRLLGAEQSGRQCMKKFISSTEFHLWSVHLWHRRLRSHGHTKFPR